MENNINILEDLDYKYGLDGQTFNFNPDIDVGAGDVIVQSYIDGSIGRTKLICVGKNSFRLFTDKSNEFITGYKLLQHSWKIS